ncbi:MAG: aldehyde ferredoxin oxidoreductase family protein [Halobacteriota archaeon]|nr:aldehyde ferredoxin oxidoreductase family protein [Halobacteriota archaeon]
MLGGYMGKIMDVNLSTGTIGNYDISDETRKLYVGGKGLGARLLFDNTKRGIDPLSPDNVLIITTGPLTGTNAPSSSRFNVSTKSPLTGAIASSSCGGDFGNHLKKAGYDGIIVRGKAKGPVFLEIDNDSVVINEGSELWGLETDEVLEKVAGEGIKRVLTIGPAGENLVLYASIVAPRPPPKRSGIAGRCGVGAVMGSKNLKAIVASGNKKVPIAKPEKFKKRVKGQFDTLKKSAGIAMYSEYGTANLVNPINAHNALPTKNFKLGSFKNAEAISGERLTKEYLVKSSGCTSCTIKCGRVVKYEGREVKGPEYETLALFGANLDIDDMDKIIEWNYICDQMGMDTISSAQTIAFAMELSENGLLATGLSIGSTENISEVLRDIAHRKGLGNDLADGVRALSLKYGGEEYAIHSKGLELPGYNPLFCVGQGLSYATSNRGGCHMGGYVISLEAMGPLVADPFSIQAKPELTVIFQNLFDSYNCLCVCVFTMFSLFPNIIYRIKPSGAVNKAISSILLHSGPAISLLLKTRIPLQVTVSEKLLSDVTGEKYSFSDLLKVGERVFNMERRYNVREGITNEDDTLAERVKGPLDKMLPRYYKLRGWTEDGIPQKDTLERLEIRV